MIKVFDKIFDHVQHGPQRKKVEQYLRNTTPDSLLGDLRKALSQRLSAINGLWTTFEAFSFHVSLLTVRGTELLGTLEDGDYSWRYDVSFTRRVNFNRILRSISRPEDPGEQQHSQPGCNTSTFVLDDVMDVLAMTQPQDISVPPSPDVLKLAAQKLIDRGATPIQFWINGEELSLLLSLLLRLRLYKTKWAREFHYGTFDEQCPQDDELARILADRLGSGQDIVLTSDQIQKGLDVLPNLELYFHQLWTTLFQPPMPANISTQKTAQPDPTLDRILRVTSLFISQHIVSSDSQTAQENRPITFERLDASSPQGLNNNLSLYPLIKALAQDSSQPNHQPQSSLLIILGNTSTPSPAPVVMGAFSPDPLWTTKPR